MVKNILRCCSQQIENGDDEMRIVKEYDILIKGTFGNSLGFL